MAIQAMHGAPTIRRVRKPTLVGMAALGLLLLLGMACTPLAATLGLPRDAATAGVAYGGLMVLCAGVSLVSLAIGGRRDEGADLVTIDPTPAPVSVDFQICVDQLVATVAAMAPARSADLYASVGGDPAVLQGLPSKVRLEEICIAVVTYARTFGDVSERLKAMLDFLDGEPADAV